MLSRMFAPPDSGLGAKADELLALFRIAHVARDPAGSLSYGQQKLVDIAMAFMSQPDLVLLDEPCAGVNPSLVGGIARGLLVTSAGNGPTAQVWARSDRGWQRLADTPPVADGAVLTVAVTPDGRLLAAGAGSAVHLFDLTDPARSHTPPQVTPSVQHSDAPYCMQCGVQMQRAGSCHACPSCGSTSGCS